MTAPTGANNDVVTQTSYTGNVTQRWRFIEQSDGTYKISPESNSNYFMAAGDISTTADQDLEIRTAQSDGGDRWEMCDFDTTVLLAIDDEDGEVRHTYFSNTKSILQTESNGIVSVVSTVRYSSLTKLQMIEYLQSSNIFIVHTHGVKTGFKISNTSPEFLYRNDLSGYDLSNISFALLLTCDTGIGTDSEHIANGSDVNIIEKMVLCGAKTVVGFNSETSVNDCNKFASELMKKMIQEGYSVGGAIDKLSNNDYELPMKDFAEIAGNPDNKLR